MTPTKTYGPHIFQRNGAASACAICTKTEAEPPHPRGAVVARIGGVVASALGLESEVLGIIRELNSSGPTTTFLRVFVRDPAAGLSLFERKPMTDRTVTIARSTPSTSSAMAETEETTSMRNTEVYRDFVSGRTKTWPYGTILTGIVERVSPSLTIVIVETAEGRTRARREGFGLTGIDITGVEVGQERQIVFKDGGALGGYWDFAR